jgi:hypothetical protein
MKLMFEIVKSLLEEKLKPNWKKCQWGQKNLTYLVHQIKEEMVHKLREITSEHEANVDFKAINDKLYKKVLIGLEFKDSNQ